MSDPTLTLEELAQALGSAPAAASAHRLVAPHLDTLVSRAGETIRPRPVADRASVSDRLPPDEPPLTFEDELGRGGMGVVRLATQNSVGRKVAVKSLRHDADGRGSASLLQEAWITGRVEHPHIVPLYDVRLDVDGQPLVVLRRIEGTSWKVLLANPDQVQARFGVADVQEWHLRTLMEVCTAVEFAHQQGIVHRDIKPENVMVGGPGETYLVDWGIARAFRPGDRRLPQLDPNEDLAGTPAYMAPEMLRIPDTQVGPHTDVYLLGATLHHILAGEPPHVGDTALTMMMNVLRGATPPPGPPELVAVCMRAMAVRSEDRYPSAEAFRQAIQHHLEHRAAGRLADDAGRRLATLEAGLAQGMPPEDRQRLFGECRFGFSQALASWPACEPARLGLHRALTLMIERALADDQAGTAAALLAELPDAAPELASRVAAAQAAAAERQVRLERLERLQHEFDPRVGVQARLVLLVAVIGLLMIRPALWFFAVPADTEHPVWIWPVTLAALATGAYLVARRSLGSTALNRRIGAMLLAGLAAYSVLSFGMEVENLPLDERSRHGLHFGASILAFFAIAVDLRALVAAGGYLAGYLASLAGLVDPHLATLGAHLVLGACIFWLARRPPPEGQFIQVVRRGTLKGQG